MTHDSNAAYRCPKCGATSALVMPEPYVHDSRVAVKCLQCAHVLRMPRQQVASATARCNSTTQLE